MKQNDLNCDCIIMENLSEELKKFSTENLSSKERNLSADDPAYVIYTSGTMANPKEGFAASDSLQSYPWRKPLFVNIYRVFGIFGFF